MTICENEAHNKAVKTAIENSASEDNLIKICNIYKAIGDKGRLKIVLALMQGEMCVYHISKITDNKQSLTSHQLKILKDSNVIKSRREGKFTLYSIADNHIKSIIEMSLQHINCHD